MPMLKLRSHYSIFYLFLMLLFFFSCGNNPKPEKLKKGFIDLSTWDFYKNGKAALSGDWYYDDLLNYSEKNESQKSTIKVPGSWNDKLKGPYGYVRYSATVRLPVKTPYLSLYLPAIYSSYKVFVNDTEISSFGNAALEPEYKPKVGIRVVDIPAEIINGPDIKLSIEVANFSYPQGGILRKVFIGENSSIHKENEDKKLIRVFIGSVIFMAFLSHFFHFIFHPSRASHLYFAITTLMLAVRNLVLGEVILYDFGIDSYSLVEKITFGTLFPLIPAVVSFVNTIFPGEIPTWFRRLSLFLGLFFSLTFFLPLKEFLTIKVYSEFALGLTLLTLVFYLGRFIIAKKPFAGVMGFIFFIAAVGAINDILYTNEIINTALISNYAMLLIIASLSIMLSYEFSSAYGRVDHIAAELGRANKNLLQFQAELENTVKERTLQLENERNELKKRNRIIDSELELAKNIQQKLIPEKVPVENIAWYYASLDIVCGDFFDFIQLHKPNQLGIFLSDVSGHGVPAAFITSLMKGILIETAPKVHDPASLLIRMYNSLHNQISGNFISAFYGIYDKSTSELTYATAGHPHPFLISPNSITQLKPEHPGPIIGILSGTQLIELKKAPRSSKITLKPGEKIIIYTDGLTEATREEDAHKMKRPQFEDDGLNKALSKGKNLPPKDFIQSLSESLELFRGSKKFEDDVCVICLEGNRN